MISAALKAGVFDGLPARLDRLLHQVVDQRLELGAGELHGQMLRSGGIGGDERQIDLGLGRRRQLDLGLFRGLLEPLQRELVAAQINALLFLEFVGQIVDQPHVEIFAAEEGVAVGRLHLEHAVADFENGNIEGAAAEVVDRDGSGLALVETVSERGCRRLVDDAQHFEAGDLAGVLGGLALRVVEVGRNGDDRLVDLGAEIGFRGLLHLLQDECGNLRRRIALALDLDPGVAVTGARDLVGNELLVLLHHRVVVAAADQAFDGKNGAFGIGDCLAFGRLADEPFALVGESYDGWRGAHPLRVLDDLRRLAFHDGDAGIRGPEIDTDDLAHGPKSSLLRQIGQARKAPSARPPYSTLNRSERRPSCLKPISLGSYRRAPSGRKTAQPIGLLHDRSNGRPKDRSK